MAHTGVHSKRAPQRTGLIFALGQDAEEGSFVACIAFLNLQLGNVTFRKRMILGRRQAGAMRKKQRKKEERKERKKAT